MPNKTYRLEAGALNRRLVEMGGQASRYGEIESKLAMLKKDIAGYLGTRSYAELHGAMIGLERLKLSAAQANLFRKTMQTITNELVGVVNSYEKDGDKRTEFSYNPDGTKAAEQVATVDPSINLPQAIAKTAKAPFNIGATVYAAQREAAYNKALSKETRMQKTEALVTDLRQLMAEVELVEIGINVVKKDSAQRVAVATALYQEYERKIVPEELEEAKAKFPHYFSAYKAQYEAYRKANPEEDLPAYETFSDFGTDDKRFGQVWDWFTENILLKEASANLERVKESEAALVKAIDANLDSSNLAKFKEAVGQDWEYMKDLVGDEAAAKQVMHFMPLAKKAGFNPFDIAAFIKDINASSASPSEKKNIFTALENGLITCDKQSQSRALTGTTKAIYLLAKLDKALSGASQPTTPVINLAKAMSVSAPLTQVFKEYYSQKDEEQATRLAAKDAQPIKTLKDILSSGRGAVLIKVGDRSKEMSECLSKQGIREPSMAILEQKALVLALYAYHKLANHNKLTESNGRYDFTQSSPKALKKLAIEIAAAEMMVTDCSEKTSKALAHFFKYLHTDKGFGTLLASEDSKDLKVNGFYGKVVSAFQAPGKTLKDYLAKVPPYEEIADIKPLEVVSDTEADKKDGPLRSSTAIDDPKDAEATDLDVQEPIPVECESSEQSGPGNNMRGTDKTSVYRARMQEIRQTYLSAEEEPSDVDSSDRPFNPS
jgi:hypothetical protein